VKLIELDFSFKFECPTFEQMPFMKGIISILIMLCLACAVPAQTVKKISIGELENYIHASERPLVVNFWATWCAPCLHELPYFQETVRQYAGKNVELVLVSMDLPRGPEKKIEEFAARNALKGTLFWLNETNADVFCPRIDRKWDGSIPSTLFINRKTGYRKFVDRQLTAPQFRSEVQLLVSPSSN
jgi:thiol-disulfide isomerase/thioredoxin